MKGVGKFLKKAVLSKKDDKTTASSTSLATTDSLPSPQKASTSSAQEQHPDANAVDWAEWSDTESLNDDDDNNNNNRTSTHGRNGHIDDDDDDEEQSTTQSVTSTASKTKKMFKRMLSFKKKETTAPPSVVVSSTMPKRRQSTLEETLQIDPMAIHDPSSSSGGTETHPIQVDGGSATGSVTSTASKTKKMFKRMLSFKKKDNKETTAPPSVVVSSTMPKRRQSTLEETLQIDPMAIHDPSSSSGGTETHPIQVDGGSATGIAMVQSSDVEEATTATEDAPKPKKKKGKKKKKKKSSMMSADGGAEDNDNGDNDDGGDDDDDTSKRTTKKKKKKKKSKLLKEGDTGVEALHGGAASDTEGARKAKGKRNKANKANSMFEHGTIDQTKLKQKAASRRARSERNLLSPGGDRDNSNVSKRRRPRSERILLTAADDDGTIGSTRSGKSHRRRRTRDKKKRSTSMEPKGSPTASPKRSRSMDKPRNTLRSRFGEFVARSRSRSRSISRRFRRRSAERNEDDSANSNDTPRRGKKPESPANSQVSVMSGENDKSTDGNKSTDKPAADMNNNKPEADTILDQLNPAQDALKDAPMEDHASVGNSSATPSISEAEEEVPSPAVADVTTNVVETTNTAPAAISEAEEEVPSPAVADVAETTTNVAESTNAPAAPVAAAATTPNNNIRLQEQLSEALEKVVKSTEETITVKDELLQTTQTLTKTQAELHQISVDRDTWKSKAETHTNDLQARDEKIDHLKITIDEQLDQLERTDRKLELADEEIRELEDELRKVEDELVELKVQSKRANDSNDMLIMTYEEQEVAQQRILALEEEVATQRAEIQQLKSENTTLQGQLKARDLEWNIKVSKKDDVIATLQKDTIRLTRELEDRENGNYTSLTKQVKEKQTQLSNTQSNLEQAQRKIEKLTEQTQELQSNNTTLEEQMKLQAAKTKEWQEKNTILQDKLTNWTEKTYEWKQRAETAEHKLSSVDDVDAEETSSLGGSVHSSANNSGVEPSGQALFLQAAMDRKGNTNNQNGNGNENNNRKSFLGSFGWKNTNNDQEDFLSEQDYQFQQLKDENDALQQQISKLQSEMVKLQTSYKEESYLKIKRIQELENENCDYAMKNA
eukprot:CAMPEP_0119571028 /NCGR_PEP_ID=MMETSP1352-20130426/43912_1 /TAXON_ID=265584 /ORGANISM="Stauroneis constricta, Strain CCMP1120" /LENGTH=1118 /DNA_ID=CAMNT_0007620705 /DNA_START=232 /DNA_END=3583 /DNA_ORIENTATION=+